MLAIITGGDDKESRYFQRPMCVEELKWAIEGGVKIVPVVTAADKPKVGELIEEGKAAGIDLSACDFQHVDRSNTTMMKASLKQIIHAERIAEPGKAELVGELANAGSSVQGSRSWAGQHSPTRLSGALSESFSGRSSGRLSSGPGGEGVPPSALVTVVP